MKSKLLQITVNLAVLHHEHAGSEAACHLEKAQAAMEIVYQARATAGLESNEVTVLLLNLLANEKEASAAAALKLALAEERLNQARTKACVVGAVVDLIAVLDAEMQADGIDQAVATELKNHIAELEALAADCDSYLSLGILTRILAAAIQRFA